VIITSRKCHTLKYTSMGSNKGYLIHEREPTNK
jgi:hypothetical protein